MNRSAAWIVLVAFLAACPLPFMKGPEAPKPWQLKAGPSLVEVSLDAKEITLRRDEKVLLRFPADAFQLGTVRELNSELSYDPYWLEMPNPSTPPDDLEWENPTNSVVTNFGERVLEMELTYTHGAKAKLTFEVDSDDRYRVRWEPHDVPSNEAIAWMRVRPRASATEAFYGLGGWLDDVNHRGKLRAMQMETEANIESANNEAHTPIPLLIGTEGWGVFVKSRLVGAFDVARKDPTLVEITYGTAHESASGLEWYLFAANHPLDITKHYYDVTSYPILPAPWALGPWIWRDENRDQAQVLDDIQTIRQLDLATSAIWIDRPYASGVNTFDFNPAMFTDAAGMIQNAHANGLRVALWHTPYLAEDAAVLRTEAQANGYFPPVTGILLNRWSKPIDFTNVEAYGWWQSKIRQYTDLGIEGFKLDYAEDVVPSLFSGRNIWNFGDGQTERTMHYGYTLLYHRVYAETLPADGGFLLCRAGRWGDQAHVSVIWPGDLDATFTKYKEEFTTRDGDNVVGVGGLPASIIMGLNLGPSGFPFFGADTGGYRHSPPDNELFIRWFQQTALSSVMQVGDSSSQTPWEFTTENGRSTQTVDIYRTYARLHMRLFPYEWTYAKQIATTGRPIQRPLGLAHPSMGVHVSDAYMFGDDLLVAPVVTRGETTRNVVLPPGEWIDWWDGTAYSGSAVIPAPLEKLPLLVRAGAIIPMLRPTIDTISPATEAGVESYANNAGALYVRVVPGPAESSFTLYDDTRLSRDTFTGGNDVAIVPGSVFTTGVVVELMRVGTPNNVTAGDVPLTQRASLQELEASATGWFWQPESGGTLWVKVGPGEQHIRVR